MLQASPSLGGNGGILPPKIVKKYEFSMAYFSFKVSISTAGKTLKYIQSQQGVNYIWNNNNFIVT